jgi:acyl CoA:acetate/3-ketoacid CoA transferase beta subunit
MDVNAIILYVIPLTSAVFVDIIITDLAVFKVTVG